MKSYRAKIAELAKYAHFKATINVTPEFELRIDDKDPDYLSVRLYMRNERGKMENASCMVDVTARPGGGSVRLAVNLSCTFCHEYGAESIMRIGGFARIERLGRAFYNRTKDQVYEA